MLQDTVLDTSDARQRDLRDALWRSEPRRETPYAALSRLRLNEVENRPLRGGTTR